VRTSENKIGFEPFLEDSESRSRCNDVWQTVPKTASGDRKSMVADSDESCSSEQ